MYVGVKVKCTAYLRVFALGTCDQLDISGRRLSFGSLGEIHSNSLEESNVNVTNELVDLIKAQSNYQANAKTISTQSTIMQTIIQMT